MNDSSIMVKINGSSTTATVETDQEGLHLSGSLGSFRISWEDLHKVLSTPGLLEELAFAEAVSFSPTALRTP
jgi:hypothetical protein